MAKGQSAFENHPGWSRGAGVARASAKSFVPKPCPRISIAISDFPNSDDRSVCPLRRAMSSLNGAQCGKKLHSRFRPQPVAHKSHPISIGEAPSVLAECPNYGGQIDPCTAQPRQVVAVGDVARIADAHPTLRIKVWREPFSWSISSSDADRSAVETSPRQPTG